MEFLHDFSKEVSRPIERDDRIHIEYLPTQAFTEYIRYRFQDNNGSHLTKNTALNFCKVTP